MPPRSGATVARLRSLLLLAFRFLLPDRSPLSGERERLQSGALLVRVDRDDELHDVVVVDAQPHPVRVRYDVAELPIAGHLMLDADVDVARLRVGAHVG